MSEQELREGLRAAVVDEPALAFDPDALMARAQREIKRRRALFGAGTATVAVAVAAVAVPTMLGPPRHGTAAGGPGPNLNGCATETATGMPTPPKPSEPPEFPVPTASPGVSYKVGVPGPGMEPTPVPMGTPVPATPKPTARPGPSEPVELTTYPCPPPSSPEPPGTPVPPPLASASVNPPLADFPWPPPGIEVKHYTAAQLRQRGEEMRAYLKVQFAKVVPGATDVSVDEFGGEASSAVSDGQGYLDGFVHYTLKDGRSAVDVAVFAPGAGSPPSVVCAQDGCSVREGPAGTKLVFTKVAVGPEGKKSVVAVSHYRADGSVVMISGYNYDPTSQEKTQVLPGMPVNDEQLVALATDSKIGL